MSFLEICRQLLPGMGITLQIFFITLLFSIPLGLAIAIGRMSRFKIVSWIFRLYIDIMRGTPLMLQLLVVYFGPYYMFGINISSSYRGIAVMIAFSINYAAYFAEIYRAGINSIDKGQWEAAYILGYNKVQTFAKIILPQMKKRIIPPMTNEMVTLVKDTSLAFSIAYAEMFTEAKRIASAQTSMMPFVAAALFYFSFNAIISLLSNKVEKKLSYYD
ncbi:MAG: amino acid ABC transporter permease [Lachnospiraceae bacterium]|nr:amino acid ABC transporter permease [Lachnospiraceae bacterium]